jgi:hypothetical protein
MWVDPLIWMSLCDPLYDVEGSFLCIMDIPKLSIGCSYALEEFFDGFEHYFT